MRTFAIIAFVLSVLVMQAPAVRAQSCPTGCTADVNGVCYSNADGVTPCGASAANQNPPQGGNQNVVNPPQGGNPGVTLMNPLGTGTTINSFLLSILNIITNTIGPVIVILMLVYVGFKFVAAQGNESKLTEAKQMLLWTVIGALVLLGAKVIAMGIQATVQALSTG